MIITKSPCNYSVNQCQLTQNVLFVHQKFSEWNKNSGSFNKKSKRAHEASEEVEQGDSDYGESI